MKKHLILWLLLLLSGSAWAQLSIRESFEGTSSEYGYTSSFSNTTSNSVYFTRTTNPKTGFGNPVVQPTPDGSWFWASEGVRDFNRTIPSATLTLNGIPNAGNYNNIQISILVTDPRAATNSPVASSDEHLRIQYVYTPTNVVPAASSFITAGEFRGLNPGTVSSWYQFVNGTQGPALTGSFTNFDFSIPNGTGYLFVRVEADQNQPGAELGFDNIRVTGSQATTLRPTLTTTDTGDRAYAEGAAALPIFTNLTVDNPSGTTLDAAKVVFTNGTRVAAQDELTYTIPAGSGITFDAANSTNGALAFTGSSSEANYQNLLLSVRYRNITSTAARGGTRSFAFTVSDGANTSSPLNRNVVVTATLNSAVGLAVPFTVDFETDGEGTTYGSNTATSGTQGFVRLTGAPGATFNSTTVFSQIQGSGYFYGRGTKEFLPASSDGLPTAGNNIATPLGGVLMLAPINTTGYTNLHFKLKAAAAGNTFSSDDFLRFSYNLNSGAGWQAFPSGNFTGSGGALLQNGTGTALTTTMQDVDITLPAAVAGTNVSFRVEVGDNGGEEIAFDNIQVTGTPVPTTITSIVRASTNPTNATTVQYTVTFAASVTGLTTANFSVTTTGTLGATPSVSSVSGSGTTYTVTVNTGSGSGTLTLNLNNSTGLTPSVSNVPFAGETYTIDKTAPTTTITSSTPGVSNGSTTATTPIAFTVTFTENVSNFTSSDVQVTGGTLSGFFAASNSTYTFNVTPSGSGSTVRVNVAANVAQDLAGNGNTAASQYSVTYQQPLVASSQAVTVNLTANGTATLNASSVNNGSSGGGTLTYTIQKIVYGRVAEGSTLALSTPNGANFTSIPFAVYGSPTGTNGNYGPSTCGSPTGNGGTPGTDVRATVGSFLINRNSGTIDANNNTFGDPCSGTPKALAVQAAYSANALSLTYDCSEANKTQYVLLTVSSSDGQTSTSVAQVTVNPSPTITISNVSPTSALRGTPVTVTGTNLSGVTSVTVNGATATVSNLTANGFTFVVPTTATFGAGNLTVTAPCAQTVTSAFTVQQPVTAAPVVTAPANGSLTNNSQPTYSGTAPVGSTVTVYVGPASGAATAIGTTTATASGNFSLAQPTALTSGSYQVYATAQTSGSTVSANSNTNTFTVDTTAPTVTSLTSSTVTNGGSTTTSPVLFTATFSEPVTGFASGDIAVSGGTVTSGPTAGSGNTFTFQVTPSGAGNVTVQVLANTVQDQAGNFNPASSTYSFTYSLPLVTATLTQVTPSPTATATLTYRATFSGGVTGLNTGNFSVANSGTSVSGASVASVTAVSGSTTTYDVVVNTGTGNGSLELQLVNSTGVSPTVSSLPVRGPGYTLYKSFLAKPTLRIQGMGSPSGFSDVTAFVDLVQVLQSGTTTVVTNGIQNGSFEANNVPAGGFLYQQTGVVASPWTFTTQAGVSRNGSGFGSTAADLNAVALLQSLSSTGNNGSVAQPLAVPTGSYQVRFRAAERTNNGRNDDQVLNVYLLDNFNNTVFVGSIQPDISGLGLYGTFTSATFTVTAAPLTATVSTSSTSPTSTAPIPFSVSFTQSVGTSFTASDVTVTGGTLTSGSFSGSGAGPYTFTVTPSGFGTVSVTLADNVAFDDNNTGNAFTNTASVQFAAPTITVSPATLVGGTRGTSYSQALSASGGTAPYSYAITAGALPTGLTLTAAGLLSGTPAASGSFTFTVTATDASAAPGPYSGSRSYTLTIAAPTIVVAPATLLTGTVATAYSQALSASGGTAPYAYAITAGALPAGLSLTNGTIAGTPTAGGSFTFVVTATDASTAGSGGPYSGSRSYTLTVAAPTITVAPASLPNGTQGTAYSQTLTASGGTAPYAFAITAGALPAGLSFANGTLSGTPTASGTFNFTVTATDASTGSGPYTGARSYTLTIGNQPVTAAPVITSPANNALTNQAVDLTGTAPAGSTVTLYVSLNGSAPQSTSLTATSAGTFSTGAQPLPDGTYQVYATAQSPGAVVSASSGTITFTVDTTRPSVAISSTAGNSGSNTGTSPIPFTVTFLENVSGFVAGDVTVTNGTITGGVVNGTSPGMVYSFTVTPTTPGTPTTVNVPANVAQDGAGNGNTAAPAAYSLTFQAPTITVTPTTLTGGTQGVAYSQTLTASGGTSPYTFARTAGALPAGLTLTTAGVLSGTPTASGTFNFTVTATDASAAPGPYSGSRAYSLTIAAPAVTAVTWNGSTNTDWFNANNWTPNQVPDATLDATIPTSPSGGRFPFITANAPANARNLSIAAGASLTMTDNTLILAANLTNNGSFNGFSGSNGGTLVLGSSALGLLNGGGVNRFWNLTVGPNGAQLNNPNVTSVRRLLLLNGNFAANGNPFTLISDAAGTAMVVNNGSAVVTGNATVQRYIDPSLNPNLGYRHVSPAIGNATVSSLTTSGYTPVVNPAYNTSATPLLVPSFPTVYGYDPTRLTTTNNNLNLFDKGWYSPNALTDPLNVGQGYTVLIGGGQTWNFTGPLNNGTQTVNVARPAALPTDGSAGYNLVGNPYPSPLDWSQVSVADRPNVGGTMYVYQSNDPRNPYTGVYGFYSASAGIGTVSPVVAQGQGFFVQVAQGQTNGSVTFRNSQRPTTYTSPTYQRTTETRPLVELHLQGAGSTLTDAAFVYFEQGATDGFDAQYDAEKLPNPSGLNLSTSLSATQRLAIDGRAPLTTTQRVVPLAVGVPAVGSYTLSTAQLLNLGTTPVYLRDLQSGTVIDLRTQPSYTFTVSNASALITGRFELVFSPQAVLATAPAALAAQVGLYPNPATTTAFVELPAALGRTAVVAELVDALGRNVRTQSLPAQGAAPHRLSLADLATGVYTLHLKTSAGVIVKKLVVE